MITRNVAALTMRAVTAAAQPHGKPEVVEP